MKNKSWYPCETAIKLCDPHKRGLFIEQYQAKFIKPLDAPIGVLFYIEATYVHSSGEEIKEYTSSDKGSV